MPELSIFVSHTREQMATVRRLAAELMSRGFSIAINRYNVPPGTRVQPALERSMAEAARCIVCFSAKPGGPAEYDAADLVLANERMRTKPEDTSWLIPMTLTACELPEIEFGDGLLKGLSAIELHADWDGEIEKLIATKEGQITINLFQSGCGTMIPDTNVYIGYIGAASSCNSSSQTVCSVGEQVQFNVFTFGYTFSCASHSFRWDFGDNSSVSTSQTPTHAYSAAGIYNVSCVVSNPAQTVTLKQSVMVGSSSADGTTPYLKVPVYVANFSLFPLSQHRGQLAVIDFHQFLAAPGAAAYDRLKRARTAANGPLAAKTAACKEVAAFEDGSRVGDCGVAEEISSQRSSKF
jgi:PKD repeat protein